MNTDQNASVSRSASDGQLMESTTMQSSPSLHPRNDDAEFVVTTLPHSVRTRSRSRSNSRGSFFERRSLISRNKGSNNGYVQISDSDTTAEIIAGNARKSNYYHHNNYDKNYALKGKDKVKREKAFKKSSSTSSILDKFLDILLPKPKPRHGTRQSKKYASHDFQERSDGERMPTDWRLRKSASPPPPPASSVRPVSDKRDSSSSNSPKVSGNNTMAVATKRAVVGVTGLRNHGNTCYMNAVIQCLSHTDTLAEYFVMDLYKIDLRKRSKRNAKKYGTKGEVTEQLAKLLKALWSSQYTPEVSNQFKIVVGNHNEGFKGSEQNDAQEFLIWLLDKVHEDLNTADKKKSKKILSNHGKHNEDLAALSLANHQRSNISFVNEIFRAQFQSSVTCHNCQKLSITYDPFLCISVPIPQRQTRPMYCTVVYLDRLPKQVKMGVSVIAHGNIQDLRETLSKDTGIPEKQMIITEIHEDNFGRTFTDLQPISVIRDSDNVYVVETPCPKPADQREREEHLLLLWLNRLGAGMQAKRFGCPYTTLVRRMSTYNDLQSCILKEMKAITNAQVMETVTEAVIRLRVVDGLDGKCYLPDDVEHPLYMQTVDEALATAQEAGHGPQHLKLNVEWDQGDCDRMLADVTDAVQDHPSVDAHRNEQNLPINATLNECFELYLQAEELGVDNQWKCPNCMKHEQCVKKISLWSVPDILVIHLMRFRQTASQRTKLDTLVEFPITGLDMSLHTVHRSFNNNESGLHHNGLGFLTWSPWKRNQRNSSRGEEANIYDLYGVCNHVGMLQSGHYTAFCKNPTDGLWYNFDDTKVQPIEESAIVTPSAYILFYQRRSMSSGCSSSDSTSSAGSEHWVHRMQPAHFNAKVSKSQDNLSVVGREDKEKEKSKSLRGTRPYASMGALNAHKRHEERKVCRESIEKAHYSDEEDTECYMMMPESSV